jgi:hypothetical protein
MSIITVLVEVNSPPIVLQVVVLLSSVLMNGSEVYASRMTHNKISLKASYITFAFFGMYSKLTSLSTSSMSLLSGTSDSFASKPPQEIMFKIRQGLTIQQSPKHPGLVSRFLHGHQVLNLTEGHHPFDPICSMLRGHSQFL